MKPIRFPPVEKLLSRSMVQKIHIELPATVEHQVETYEGGVVIHSIRAAWTTGVYLGNTKEEALAEMMSGYRLIHRLAP
jgi:ribosomal protein S5